MGPITLFDKSFLQSLSVDESTFFDHFFFPVICPLFFIETLADLEKAVRQGRTPEMEVGIIAAKVPEMSGAVCSYHSRLVLGNLVGYDLPMDGRVPTVGGRPVRFEGKAGVLHDLPKEAEAFNRWQKREFLDVERSFARVWRASLNSVDLLTVAAGMRAMGIDQQNCKSLDDARAIARTFIDRSDNVPDEIRLALISQNALPEAHALAVEAWTRAGSRSLREFSPYAAHTLAVDIFFHSALASGQIGTARVSNNTDIAYLYYLPFCQIFVSSDKLHRRCVPHFLRDDQSVVWGPDLKAALARLVERYSQLSDEEKERGMMSFARTPPTDDPDCLVAKLWDRHLRPEWRQPPPPIEKDPAEEARLLDTLNRFSEASEVPRADLDFDPAEAEMVQVQRRVHQRKGSFWQLPKNMKKA